MRGVIFLMFFLYLTNFVYAQEMESGEEGGYTRITTNKYKHYIGICTGVTYYYGILYRRWFLDDVFALQFHLFPLIYKPKTYDEEDAYTRGIIKFGLTFLKTIRSYEYGRLIYYINGTLHYYTDYEYHWDNDSNTSKNKQVDEFSIGGAIGPGIEFYVWRFAFDVLLGISSEYNITTGNYRIVPAAETAIHFRF